MPRKNRKHPLPFRLQEQGSKETFEQNRRSSPKMLARILERSIQLAEEVYPEVGDGQQKKAMVVDLLNNHIDLPGISERLEEQVLEMLIDVVVALVKKDKD